MSHTLHQTPYYGARYGVCARSKQSKALRKRNGQVPYGYDRDSWGKPAIQGKGSRVFMRAVQEWWDEAGVSLCKK